MKWEHKKGVQDDVMVCDLATGRVESPFPKMNQTQGEGHQLNFRHAKFEMYIRYPVVMHEGGRGYIRLEAKAQVGDL